MCVTGKQKGDSWRRDRQWKEGRGECEQGKKRHIGNVMKIIILYPVKIML